MYNKLHTYMDMYVNRETNKGSKKRRLINGFLIIINEIIGIYGFTLSHLQVYFLSFWYANQ